MSDNRKNSKKDEVPIWFKPTFRKSMQLRVEDIPHMHKLHRFWQNKVKGGDAFVYLCFAVPAGSASVLSFYP